MAVTSLSKLTKYTLPPPCFAEAHSQNCVHFISHLSPFWLSNRRAVTATSLTVACCFLQCPPSLVTSFAHAPVWLVLLHLCTPWRCVSLHARFSSPPQVDCVHFPIHRCHLRCSFPNGTCQTTPCTLVTIQSIHAHVCSPFPACCLLAAPAVHPNLSVHPPTTCATISPWLHQLPLAMQGIPPAYNPHLLHNNLHTLHTYLSWMGHSPMSSTYCTTPDVGQFQRKPVWHWAAAQALWQTPRTHLPSPRP